MPKVTLVATLVAIACPAFALDEGGWRSNGNVNIMSLLDEGAKLVSVTVQNEQTGNRNTFLYLQLDKKLYRCWMNEPMPDVKKSILLGCDEFVGKK